MFARLACFLVLAGTVAAPSLLLAAQDPVSDPEVACGRSSLASSTIVAGLTFASYSSEHTGESCFQVSRQGKIIFRRTNDNGGAYYIGQHPGIDPDLDQKAPNIRDGADITGLGRPDLVVYGYSGGAHCCWTTWVFELRPVFRRIATLAADDTPAYFADPDHNGHYFYFADDWTFAYWPQSFAGSPVASVVLQFTPGSGGGGAYHLVLDKMSKPAPTRAEWEKWLDEASEDSDPVSGPRVWTPVMRLIYSGHSGLAWKFLDEAWPPTVPGKEKWLGDFCSRLKSSPYWRDLQPGLRDTPAACAAAKP